MGGGPRHHRPPADCPAPLSATLHWAGGARQQRGGRGGGGAGARVPRKAPIEEASTRSCAGEISAAPPVCHGATSGHQAAGQRETGHRSQAGCRTGPPRPPAPPRHAKQAARGTIRSQTPTTANHRRPLPFRERLCDRTLGRSLAELWGRAFPRPLWKRFGERVGEEAGVEGMEGKKRRRRRRRRRKAFGSLLGHGLSGSFPGGLSPHPGKFGAPSPAAPR